MFIIFVKLLPIFLAFTAAYSTKRAGVFSSSDGDRLLKVAFYFTIPPLVFVSAANIQLTHQLLTFVLLPVIVTPVCFIVARLFSSRVALNAKQKGVFAAAPMIINSGFVLPFLLAMFGQQGATRVALFNILNNPLIFVWAYGIIASYALHAPSRRDITKKIVLSPPLWGLILGLLWNISGVKLPQIVETALLGVGNLTGMIIIIALGFIFTISRLHVRSALIAVAIRAVIGLAIGLLLVWILRPNIIDTASILLLASAPVGFNLLTFVSVEKLDEAYAAQVVSYSILVSLALIPFLLFLVL